jgi:hypothetical protein
MWRFDKDKVTLSALSKISQSIGGVEFITNKIIPSKIRFGFEMIVCHENPGLENEP